MSYFRLSAENGVRMLIKIIYKVVSFADRSGCSSSSATTADALILLFWRHCLFHDYHCIPFPTPAGMFILIMSSFCTIPSHSIPRHFFVIVLPSPPQAGHMEEVCICRALCLCQVTCPYRHVVQSDTLDGSAAPVPLQAVHVLYLLTLIFFSTPDAIS